MLSVGLTIASSLRALTLSAALPAGTPRSPVFDGPRTALFDSAGELCSLDERAEQWFTELAGPLWRMTKTLEPPVLTTVTAALARAQAVAAGRADGCRH